LFHFSRSLREYGKSSPALRSCSKDKEKRKTDRGRILSGEQKGEKKEREKGKKMGGEGEKE